MRSKPIDITVLKMVALILAGLLIWRTVAAHHGKTYWFNFTGSEPRGLYKLEQIAHVRRGDLVLFNLPASYHPYVYGRHWLPQDWPLIKHVGGVAGDCFCVRDGSFQINGVRIGPVYQVDSAGLPLPRLEGCRQISAGYFLPVAQRLRRSFDGRYMGPIPITAILGKMKPVWTE